MSDIPCLELEVFKDKLIYFTGSANLETECGSGASIGG